MGIFNKRGRPFKDETTVLSRIASLFIQPLIKHLTDDQSEQVYLETCVFHIDDRQFEHFETIEEFEMPGLSKEYPGQMLWGASPRTVAVGDLVWSVTDLVTKRVTTSFLGGQGGKELVFELTAREWYLVKRRLRALEWPCDHEQYP